MVGKVADRGGVPCEKLVEIPLVYELTESSVGSGQSSANQLVTRHSVGRLGDLSPRTPVPVTGNRARLQALFLGSVSLRKGVGQLFDAIRMLKNEPVDFSFAGPIGVRIPEEISRLPNVRFLGPVDKGTAEALYRESDVFLFPTLSDGFGLTQLEALGHGLPVIASTNCGRVVEDCFSGLVLPEVTPKAIADAIMELARDRDLLGKLKANACVPDKCHPRNLAPALLAPDGDYADATDRGNVLSGSGWKSCRLSRNEV
ncbi:MAG: glycosyltransferase family 4 protein [Chthoniobacterales bacterium]